jgi:hypothetical protein
MPLRAGDFKSSLRAISAVFHNKQWQWNQSFTHDSSVGDYSGLRWFFVGHWPKLGPRKPLPPTSRIAIPSVSRKSRRVAPQHSPSRRHATRWHPGRRRCRAAE